MRPSTVHTERGLDRLVNFSDAVVAIAITLLVLPLVELPNELATKPFRDVMSEHSWSLIGFGVSFLVIARLWRVHHQIFERVRDYNVTLVWLNFTWLFTIVLLPFPTALLGNNDQSGASRPIDTFYLATLTVSSAALAGMTVLIDRVAQLQVSDDEVQGPVEGESRIISGSRVEVHRRLTMIERLSSPVLLLIGTLLAATTSVGILATLLLLLSGPANGLSRLVTSRRARARS
jgi:uncharacterized membrane protein